MIYKSHLISCDIIMSKKSLVSMILPVINEKYLLQLLLWLKIIYGLQLFRAYLLAFL